MNNNSLILVCLCFFFASACNKNGKKDDGKFLDFDVEKYASTKDLFLYRPASESGLDFENDVKDDLVQNIFYYEYSFNGGGVAIGDINNDGLQDVMFSSTVGKNKLYLNQGKLKFKDITDQAGINLNQGFNTGLCFVDVNADGWLDVCVNRSGNLMDANTRVNQLFINNKNTTFTEQAAKYGLADYSYSTQSYFSDFDLDGDLDMYLVNHPIGWGKQDKIKFDQDNLGNLFIAKDTQVVHVSDRLYINENGKYVDKTKAFGLENLAFGLSAVVADFNDDNYPDIYVANDYVQPDQFYINRGGKSFTNEIGSYFKNISTTSMGSDVFDANNDGKLDIFVNDMMPQSVKRMKENKSYVNYDAHILARKFGYHDQYRYNSFQIKNDLGKFSNVAQLTGTAKTDWSWSALGADYDHNGFEDLFITNGYFKDLNNSDYSSFVLDSLKRKVKQQDFFNKWNETIASVPLQNYLFSNNGNLVFNDVSSIWNAGKPSFSNGAAYGDLDNDGDLDMIVNNINEKAFLMENTLNNKTQLQYLRVVLNGGNQNYFAVGSELTLNYTDGSFIKKLFNPIRGYMSSCEYVVHFGIPAGKQIKDLVIKWPEGKYEVFNVKANAIATIKKGGGQSYTRANDIATPIFSSSPIAWAHKENEYIDFKREPLLHLENSSQGPATAVADVNGDGKEDVFLGGAHLQPSTILLKSADGWTTSLCPDFVRDAAFEDVAAVFGDFDGDGDNDLVVASGGYEWEVNHNNYLLRYYSNNGKGIFSLNSKAIPDVRLNAASCIAMDADNDKDLDILVGGGAIPNKYPYGENSRLLINTKGVFIDKSSMLPENGSLGIVRSIATIDINKDGFMDVVTAGDWQEINVLYNEKGAKFSKDQNKSGLSKTNGLWQSLLVEDIDGDGDEDIIAGNLGRNTFFSASESRPTCIYANDYDDNKELDAIMCTYFGNHSYPVHSRDELLAHMTKLRKKFLRYRDYSTLDINDIFSSKVDDAEVFNAFTFESSVFYNDNGKFSRIALPMDAQMSMVNGLNVMTTPNQKMLVCTGNFWDTDYDFGRYDASIGVVYLVKDKQFEKLNHTGLIADGNIRKQNRINIDNKSCIMLTGSNETATMFCLNK